MFVLDTNVVSELRKAKAGKADRNVAQWASRVATNSLFVSANSILLSACGFLGTLYSQNQNLAKPCCARARLKGLVQDA
jgi:hypothetical protein